MLLSITVLYILSVGLMLLLAKLILSSGDSPAHNTLLTFTCIGVFWALSMYMGYFWATPESVDNVVIPFRFAFAFGLLAVAIFPIFFHLFPKPKPQNNKRRFAIYAVAIGAVTLVSLLTEAFYVNSTVVTSHVHTEDVLGEYYWVYTLTFLVCFISAIVIGLKKVASSKGVERKKALVAVSGLIVAFLASIITNIVLPIFNIFTIQVYSPLFSLFFTGSAFYAIVRYRFLDISLSLQQFLSTVSVIGIYVAPALILRDKIITSPLASIVLYAILGIAYYHIKSFTGKTWNYVLFGRWMNSIEELRQSKSFFQESLDRGLAHIQNALQVQKVQFAFAGNNSIPYLTNAFQSNEFSDLVSDELDYVPQSTISQRRWSNIKTEMREMLIAAAIPVKNAEGKLLGVLLLEKKVNGKLFSTQEIRETKKVLKEAAYYVVKENNYRDQIMQDLQAQQITSATGFFDNFMHEIRHPLMIAQSVGQLSEWKNMKPEDREYLQQSEEALSDVHQKLDAISEAFQWKNQFFSLEKSYISIKDFLALCSTEFSDKNLKIRIKKNLTDILVSMDVYRLKEALIEIIKNGFFFNQSSKPKVSITAEMVDEKIQFSIKDNGSGIKRQNWENIFDLLFVESFSRNRGECGLGVGLTKAQGIIKSHDGTIQVLESSADKGTTLLITITLDTLKR